MVSADNLLFGLTLVTALGTGLMAGLFFTFSVTVMAALSRLPVAEGVRAMQSINVVIVNPVFLAVFFGTAAGCAALSVAAVWRWQWPDSGCLLAGGLLYLLGNLAVTVLRNVPMNNRLAAVDGNDVETAWLWRYYLSRWTAWNHVRTVTGLLATMFLSLGLR